MSESIEDWEKAQIREFRLKLELLIVRNLPDVSTGALTHIFQKKTLVQFINEVRGHLG